MNEENNNQEQELDLNKLMQVRREKLEELQKEGKSPKSLRHYYSILKMCFFKSINSLNSSFSN